MEPGKKIFHFLVISTVFFLLIAVLSPGYGDSMIVPLFEDGCNEECPEHCEDSDNKCDGCANCHITVHLYFQSIQILTLSDLKPSTTENFIPVLYESILADNIEHPPKSV
jgi:hypothetical protein